jgi:hypothetical protein
MNPGAIPGVVLTVTLAALAIVSASRQLAERRGRSRGLSAEDAAYFRGKDHRRLAASAVMLLVVGGMAVGLLVDPRRDPDAARLWVASWSTVLSLLLVLVALATWDWLALHGYARRHRSTLQRERELLLRDIAGLARKPPATEPDGPAREPS